MPQCIDMSPNHVSACFPHLLLSFGNYGRRYLALADCSSHKKAEERDDFLDVGKLKRAQVIEELVKLGVTGELAFYCEKENKRKFCQAHEWQCNSKHRVRSYGVIATGSVSLNRVVPLTYAACCRFAEWTNC